MQNQPLAPREGVGLRLDRDAANCAPRGDLNA